MGGARGAQVTCHQQATWLPILSCLPSRVKLSCVWHPSRGSARGIAAATQKSPKCPQTADAADEIAHVPNVIVSFVSGRVVTWGQESLGGLLFPVLNTYLNITMSWELHESEMANLLSVVRTIKG